MLIKNFLRLLGEKFNLIGKISLVVVFSMIIFASISATIFNTSLKEFKREAHEKNIPLQVREIFKESIYNQKEAKKLVKEKNEKFKELLLKNKKGLKNSALFFIILTFGFAAVISTIKYILSFAIKEFMDVGANEKLINIYVANFFKCLRYSLLSGLIGVILAVVDTFIIYGFFILMIRYSVFLSFMFIGVLLAILISFNYVFLGQWENIMVIENKGVLKALKGTFYFGFKNFKNVGSHIYLLMFFSIFFFNTFGIFTFGIGFFIAGIILLIAFRVMTLIEYYETNNLPYYIAKDTIYYNKNKINN